MDIKVLTGNIIKDNAGKVVKVVPSVQITVEDSETLDTFDKENLEQFKADLTKICQKFCDQALKQGLSPDTGDTGDTGRI